jgi:hypothetical protein
MYNTDSAAWRFGSVNVLVVASDRHRADPLHTHTHNHTLARVWYLSPWGLAVPPANIKTRQATSALAVPRITALQTLRFNPYPANVENRVSS